MILFENIIDKDIWLNGPKDLKTFVMAGQKIVLDEYYRRYVPEFLRPIRQEPSTDYMELVSQPLMPVSGQYWMDVNKQQLLVYTQSDKAVNIPFLPIITTTSSPIRVGSYPLETGLWKEVARRVSKDDWEWTDEKREAPNVKLPGIGELGQLGKRKISV